jgi:hypothetical protein
MQQRDILPFSDMKLVIRQTLLFTVRAVYVARPLVLSLAGITILRERWLELE